MSENGDCTFQRRQLFSLYWGEPAISQSAVNVSKFKAMYKPKPREHAVRDRHITEKERINMTFQITSIPIELK